MISNTTKTNQKHTRVGAKLRAIGFCGYEQLFVEQRATANYYTPYKFSAKEKDEETSYSYFGARYYMSDISIWLSVDPLKENYPYQSPYTYCGWNPVMIIDPDGRSEGDGIYKDENGNVIGDDGKADWKEYVIKTAQTYGEMYPEGSAGGIVNGISKTRQTDVTEIIKLK